MGCRSLKQVLSPWAEAKLLRVWTDLSAGKAKIWDLIQKNAHLDINLDFSCICLVPWLHRWIQFSLYSSPGSLHIGYIMLYFLSGFHMVFSHIHIFLQDLRYPEHTAFLLNMLPSGLTICLHFSAGCGAFKTRIPRLFSRVLQTNWKKNNRSKKCLLNNIKVVSIPIYNFCK